jgi:hypothetical protein
MKKLFVFAAVSAIALSACQSRLKPFETPDDTPIAEPGLIVFSATTEGALTKTSLSPNEDKYDVLWNNGDRITIVDGAATPNVGVYSTTSTATHADFSFVSGNAAVEPVYKAYYPAEIYNAGTPALPATQDYVAGNIGKSPMYAVSNTNSLGFKNICGIVRINLKTNQPGIKVQSITLQAESPLSGPISNAATLVADGYAAAVSGTSGVTLDCGAGVDIDNVDYTPFLIAVPVNEAGYSAFAITVTTISGAYQTFTVKSGTGIVVERSKITDINLTARNILYDLPAEYTAVEYLESSGTQYIDTGVPCHYNDFVDIDFMYTGSKLSDYPNEGGSVFGAHGWSKANGVYEKCIYWCGYGKIAYTFAVGTKYNVTTISNTQSKITDLDSGVDGTTRTLDKTSQKAYAPFNFYLFTNRSDYWSAGWYYWAIARIYSCKLFDSDKVWLRYFVPCVRNADSEPGMYDRVNDVFYPNEGTGVFTVPAV